MIRVLALIVLFLSGIFAVVASDPLDTALWNTERTAAADATPGKSGTRIVAFLKQQDGSFLEIDLSQVEGGNFGKLGWTRADCDHFETKPVEWLPRQDDLLQVKIQTQAWRAGQRYTVSESVALRRDGTVLWR